MNMNRPSILLVDVFNVCLPIQNIQIIDKITNDVIAEGKEWELHKLLNEYGEHEVYKITSHRDTLIIIIKP